MGEIIYQPNAVTRLEELIAILHEKEYFGFLETACDYVREIYRFAELLPHHRHRLTKNKRWGQYYVTYKANRYTSWVLTFYKFEGDRYIIRNIFNNHTVEYPRFIQRDK